jgi:uncharacterized protein (DUF1330 family)
VTATTIDPTAAQIRELSNSSEGGPITMLNLLRFKDRADGIDEGDRISGRQAYERYAEAVGSHLHRVGGSVSYMAECEQSVIAPEHEAWDVLVLVRYPSRQAFLEMIADPGYQASHAHRAAALRDSRLVCCREHSTIDSEA